MAERGVLGLFAGSRGDCRRHLASAALASALASALARAAILTATPVRPLGYATCILDEETEQWLLFDGMIQG